MVTQAQTNNRIHGSRHFAWITIEYGGNNRSGRFLKGFQERWGQKQKKQCFFLSGQQNQFNFKNLQKLNKIKIWTQLCKNLLELVLSSFLIKLDEYGLVDAQLSVLLCLNRIQIKIKKMWKLIIFLFYIYLLFQVLS